MAVVCTECGGSHPKWECHASAAQSEPRASTKPVLKPGPVDTNSFLTDADAWQAPIAIADEKKRGRPRIHADRNAYRAEWQRKRRLKLKEAKP